jgi:hypothetical protein
MENLAAKTERKWQHFKVKINAFMLSREKLLWGEKQNSKVSKYFFIC